MLPLYQPLSHSPFKCRASWIPAEQSASAGDIELTPNLVLPLCVCSGVTALVIATLSEIYGVKMHHSHRRIFTDYSKQALTEKLGMKLKCCF